MGLFKDVLGKALDIIKPALTAINPALGIAAGFVSGLMKGENPLQAGLGAAMDMFPGASVAKNLLNNFPGKSLLEGMGGNSLVSGLLDKVSKPSQVTDLLTDVMKANTEKGLSEQSLKNAQELFAKRMAETAVA
ncbi:hypothetical protein HUA74_19485 [Myxococcus sp. CA051A]|uniref:Uncharacterized protein n=1 Tax=Myxococcus llanfairpwllgwyngyllgogerychwyrndrobwllllantysiliogogogochensis TaxID=2590453 RepID=A0A540X218_9BACT|nr:MULTISPECIES: hypothetical protein [Myxococcus]NTX01776.1 hypothetical protein [Myxococcus sp. CA040A]NTX16421.1 hypothetical protein [Myxococcus sp. CA056]NTX55225.1 hypothetical protein [Myxococcus sp. CA039A]NTX62833.1 hypothetical protein [Myxococcus sp. CA051A]TQF14724.1 hypothetical protein FJV41_17165 [Myxococcus llanfairpwllgwyngyllgogerychwyrndrobwllllantysiliogogogochensis]